MREKTDREEYNDRLKKAFGDDWTELAKERREQVLDKLLEIDNGTGIRNEFDLKEMLDYIQNRALSMGTIIIGSLLAVAGGLTVNIIHDYLKVHSGIPYLVLAPIVFLVLIFVLDHVFDQFISDTHRKKGSLKFLLRLVEDEEQKENKTQNI